MIAEATIRVITKMAAQHWVAMIRRIPGVVAFFAFAWERTQPLARAMSPAPAVRGWMLAGDRGRSEEVLVGDSGPASFCVSERDTTSRRSSFLFWL